MHTVMNVTQLNEDDFLRVVADYRTRHAEWHYVGHRPAIVDFYAPWCGTCRQLAPVLEDVAALYADQIVVYRVDVDECPAVAEAYNIRSLPTTLFVPMQGRPVKMMGAITEREIVRLVEEVLLQDELHRVEA